MKTIIIIGCDHKIQYTNDQCGPEFLKDIDNFMQHLEHVIKKYNVDLLAEEFSQYLVERNSSSGSNLQTIATTLGKSHLFCDPDPAERIKMNIQKDDLDAREMVWLDRIINANGDNIIFVCGDSHTTSFSKKIKHAGHNTILESSGWGKDWQLKD